jgi:hypothetical protein
MNDVFVCTLLVIVFCWSYGLIADEGAMLTQLDNALIGAQRDPNQEAAFYNIFLNSDLFIPTYDIPKEIKESRVEKGETI